MTVEFSQTSLVQSNVKLRNIAQTWERDTTLCWSMYGSIITKPALLRQSEV